MLRTTDPLAFRTLKPLYEQRQGTPYGPVFLNTTFALSAGDYIWPGMVAAGPVAEDPARVKVAKGANDRFFGLFAHNCNTSIDELNGGALQTAVWKGTSSCWRIFSPAYNTTCTYTVPADGTEQLLTWDNAGKLCPDGSGSDVGLQNCCKLLGSGVNYIDVQIIVP